MASSLPVTAVLGLLSTATTTTSLSGSRRSDTSVGRISRTKSKTVAAIRHILPAGRMNAHNNMIIAPAIAATANPVAGSNGEKSIEYAFTTLLPQAF